MGEAEHSLEWALNDPQRLQALEATCLLDSPPEAAFDRLTLMASHMLKVPVAQVSLVDHRRQFFKSRTDTPETRARHRETPLSHSFCKHVVGSSKPLIVSDAREHPLLYDNAAIEDNVIAYLGVPLTMAEGSTIGSFCAIDTKPRVWTEPDVETMQNLAASVMAEVELRMLVRHFQKNCLRLRDLELEREEMVQMLVHDLRNPLSALVMSLSAMEGEDIPQHSRHCLNNAQGGAMVLWRMINDILDVSKSEAGHLDLHLADVDAAQLVRSACELLQGLITQSGVMLTLNVDPSVPLLRVDEEKLRRTLVNLISNAVQHTPQNGCIAIAIRRLARTHRVAIEIADNGTGIPKEAFTQIFKKFHGSSVPKVAKTSTGLGLPFCKMAVEAHGGHITVESELGKGTTFRVELPERAVEKAHRSLAA